MTHADLLTLLRHVETTNPCVQTAIGMLAAVAGPPDARRLIEEGLEAAERVNDRDLIDLFDAALAESGATRPTAPERPARLPPVTVP